MSLQNVEAVPKFELSDEAYASRGESFRKWKAENSPKKVAATFALGDRVQVQVPNAPSRVGTVHYFGPTEFSPGNWVRLL